MTGRIAILLLLVIFALPMATLADTNGNNAAPLTLLQQPGKNTQTTQNQNIARDDNELRDIQGPVPITEQPPYLLVAGILLALLAAGAALYWFIKKRTRPAPPPVPPWEKALQDLAEAKRLLSPERALFYMDRGKPDSAPLHRIPFCHQVDPTDHGRVSERAGGYRRQLSPADA